MESVTTATLSLFLSPSQLQADRLLTLTPIILFFFFFFAGTGYMTVMNISADVVSWIN